MLAIVRRTVPIVAVVALATLAAAAPKKKQPPKAPPPTPTKPVDPPPEAGKPVEPADVDAAKDKAPPNPANQQPGNGSGSGSGSGAVTEKTEKAKTEPDVDTLRQEYLALRDELFKSSARANAVASQLYSTRITIRLTWTSARFYGVTKASVRLDGANVYEDATGAIAGDDGIRFEGYVAPGRHLVTFHVDATGKDDDTITSATETQVVVKAIGGKDLVVAAKAHDNGDIAYEWKKKERGSYALGVDVAVTTQAAGAAEKKK
jgi:hypothetical protein